MGLIAAAAFVLAIQTGPKGSSVRDPSPAPTQASKARLDEIWDHIDNRFVTQSDVWYKLGEFPLCIALLRVQSAYSPDDYDIVTNLGWMLENIEQYDESRAVYLDFGNRHPNDGDAMYFLGLSYYTKKEYANVIKVLEPTLVKKPGPNTYRTLARSYELIKKPAEAIRIWELQLKRFPNDPAAVANIKRVKAKMEAGGK